MRRVLVAADAGFYSASNEAVAKEKKASKGSVCLIALPKALTVDASRKNAGSAMARSGGPDARGASA